MYKEASRDVSKSSKDTFKAEQTSIVYDADGNEIKKLKQEKDVSYLDYEDIPDAAKLAIISIEDKNFTTHHGIDIEGVARAGLSLVLNREILRWVEARSHSSLQEISFLDMKRRIAVK